MKEQIKDKQLGIWFIYILGGGLMIPIISYYLSIPDILPMQAYIQVYLSGPILVVLGLLLFFFYRKKPVGLFFFIMGIWWILNIVYELLTK
ncbi:hypothetical protein DBR11_21120 [Pedobacter sp. HMWF019]|uniref:hypothetical protein n=1 Tax=Pedobacter sp. HMWF019 TaxID=2056856 RepID=UPI000D3B7B48|nr:hypothetical protein [Pedobacter sp. HMWF019]PTS95557.1 hypothetical protein DBR11_21120 [Pedobacter sp. HMWF019]